MQPVRNIDNAREHLFLLFGDVTELSAAWEDLKLYFSVGTLGNLLRPGHNKIRMYTVYGGQKVTGFKSSLCR